MMFYYRFPLVYILTYWFLYFTCTVNLLVFIYLTIFICKVCEELELLKLSLENSDINDSQNLTVLIRKHSQICDYGQEVCDFATAILLPLHWLYAAEITFTAAIVFTVRIDFHNILIGKNI